MEVWVVCLVVSAVCLVIGLLVPKKKPRAAALKPLNGATMSQFPMMPSQWDEKSIVQQLQQLRDQKPTLIPYFVDSVKERFILRQDDRTAQVRLQFLKTQIEQLKLAKEYQQTVDDLQLLGLEKTKRIKTIELETEEIDIKKRVLTQKEKLEALREQKKLELEIAQLDQQIEGIKAPHKPDAKLSPEEQKVKDRSACEAKIQSLKQEKQKALKIDDEDERVLKVNAVDAALEREYERWAKLL